MRPGFWAVASAAYSVTLRAFVCVNLLGCAQVGIGRRQGILQALVFRRDDPRLIFLSHPVNDQDASEKQESDEKRFAQPEGKGRVRGHKKRRNFRITMSETKGNVASNLLM